MKRSHSIPRRSAESRAQPRPVTPLTIRQATAPLFDRAAILLLAKRIQTDAAMSARAECVMLNKGPHILAAMRFLNNVLLRMQQHQYKKRDLMRRLEISLG